MRSLFIVLATFCFTAFAVSIFSPCIGANPGIAFDHQSLNSAAVEFIRNRLGVPFDSICVSIDFPEATINNKCITAVRFEQVNERALVGTSILKMIASLCDGNEMSQLLTARIRIFRRVAVSAHRLPRHAVLAPQDIRMELREITSLSDRPVTSYEEVMGRRTRRSISGGRVLVASDFEPIPIIERGSGVMVSVVVGLVTVTSKGMALEDGSIGAKIRVQDLTTGRRLVGTVVGKGLVVLEGPAL